MQVGIVHDPCFRDHATGRHPERPERLEAIDDSLKAMGLLDSPQSSSQNGRQYVLVPFEPAPIEAILKVHQKEMVERVFATSNRGGGFLDPDTILCGESARVATQAVGAGLAAVRTVLRGDCQRVFCVVRPPGHHAGPHRSMGFCLFNNIAIATEVMLEADSIRKVAIVDFDVHHGNGTQDFFYNREDVFFYSIHQFPHYPGTGLEDECGTGPGRGTTLNCPLPGNIATTTWFDAFKQGLDAVAAFQPDAILVSAGFDCHRRDPLGDFPLDESSFHQIAEQLSALASSRGLICFLEGGYNLEALGPSVGAFLEGLG
jgi:acetoin utilization deacetylase AcuC-like enzyme